MTLRGTFALLLLLSGACASQPAALRTVMHRPTPLALSSPTPSASVPPPVVDPPEPVAEFKEGEGVPIAAGPSGHLGAWLALGPFRTDDTLAASRPAGIDDDRALQPAYGATPPATIDVYDKPKKKWGTSPAQWTIASSGEGAIDLEKVFGSQGKGAIGYLGGVLRVPKKKQLLLLVGSDDGCEVIVDGKSLFARDASRPQRDDDDLVPLDLDAGDHRLLFKLHQRDGGWAFRARIVDRTFAPPYGVRLLLPGATADVARSLAKTMSWVRIVREPVDNGYAIATLIRYPEGAPLGVPLSATGSVVDVLEPTPLGALAIDARNVLPLRAEIGLLPAMIEDAGKTHTVRVDIAGRVVDGSLAPRRAARAALLRARAFLSKTTKVDDVRATIEHLEGRLTQQITRGDLDTTAQLADAKFLDAFVADAEAGLDPIAKRTGPMRLAHIARADEKPQAIGVYVPKTTKKVPLYVGLHGMNGGPMSMLRVFFGGDDEKKSMGELERTMGPIPSIDAFVIAPHAHGNAMYRQLGEEEVMDAIAWARSRWSNIDPDRIYITGFSMGGIGAASIPLHHPDFFAAAQPLCGYHSYFIRRDVAGRPRRPWEQLLLEDRSNVSWVDNGARLPLWIIHGTRDLPEENSGVLIDAYEKKGFSIKHEHPDLGHDVWGYAYDKMQHLSWFSGKKRQAHPTHVRFRTTRPRFGDDAWVHIDQTLGEWATIDARANGNQITVTTKGVGAFHLDRDPALFKDGPITVTIDGTAIGELAAHRENDAWVAGPVKEGKRGRIAGPIRDVWSDPLVVVYGTEDPTQTVVNLEVARAFATIRYGVDVSYPIVRDVDVDPDAVPTRATIAIGNARSNRLVRALEPSLPIRVTPDVSLTFAGKTFSGSQVGAAFVVPHPRAPDQYLLVIEGVDALGTFRALSLPELLPDFVIWDERLAPARGQSLLGFGAVLAAGFFDTKWQPPKTLDDPLIKVPTPKSEKDATPYLP